MSARDPVSGRSGARKMGDVPAVVLEKLAVGEIETVNLMEWLAADMSALARNVARASPEGSPLRSALLAVAEQMVGQGVTERLRLAGKAIALGGPPGSPHFQALADHKSDLVRQWACYAVNDSSLSLSPAERLIATMPFAADRNMSVRETAWMAFRPHLSAAFDAVLPEITKLAGHANDNVRRFAVEVTRPRSVWGAHLAVLKRDPEQAVCLLNQVRADPSRYVKLALGNWLNDASKTRPDWVIETCRRWAADDNAHTKFILRRGLRTLSKQKGATVAQLAFAANDALELMERVS